MDLLILDDDLRAYPHPSIVEITEFRDLIRRDRGSKGDSQGRKKLRAVKELAYIYHMVDHRSPYSTYDEDLRREEVINDLFKDEDWEPDDTVMDAYHKYAEMIESPLVKLLKSAILAVNKLRTYFEELDFTLLNDKGYPVYSARDAINNLANLGKVVDGLEQLKQQVEKDQQGRGINRRAVETNIFSE